MRNFKLIILLFFISVVFAQLEAKTKYPNFIVPDDIQKTTVDYAFKDSILRMDIYQSKTLKSKPQPVMIHLFGGAFMAGTRDEDFHSYYAINLARNGITSVFIDYRLGWKGAVNEDDSESETLSDDRKQDSDDNFIERLLNAVQDVDGLKNTFDMPVEDLYDATNFLIKHARKYNVDPNCFMISGSSAGAMSVLRAEWMLKNSKPISKKLPSSFTYKGIVSFSGAIYTNEGYPYFQKAPAPILFFHGTNDKVIVRRKGWRFFREGLYTAETLKKDFRKNFYPYISISLKGKGHGYTSNEAMTHNFEEIMSFINELAINKKKIQKEYTITYENDDRISSYEEEDEDSGNSMIKDLIGNDI